MPKKVDHEIRRKKVAEAAWRVILREGLEKASVRTISQEANMSLGAMRHYFKSQSDLWIFCMQMVIDRVTLRIQKLHIPDDIELAIHALIDQVLPIDEERRAESEVWLAFISKSLVDPELHRLRQESHESLHQLFRNVMDALISIGNGEYSLDPELETMRLHALIDGFAVHGVTQKEKISVEEMKKVVHHHIRTLLHSKQKEG